MTDFALGDAVTDDGRSLAGLRWHGIEQRPQPRNAMTETMPRLSETLEYKDAASQCHACGMVPSRRLSKLAKPASEYLRGRPEEIDPGLWIDAQVLEVWQEHDDQDQPEARVVLLCHDCADKIIEPHPRLYALRPRRSNPTPGVLAICMDCPVRVGNTCPKAKLYGGEGVVFRPEPSHVHLDGRDKNGRRWGRWELWFEPSTACSGKNEAAKTKAEAT